MELYNRSEKCRQVVADLDKMIESIPAGDAAYIILSTAEFCLAEEALGWKTGLFRPNPQHKGVMILRQGGVK